jgi:hypothetical protein
MGRNDEDYFFLYTLSVLYRTLQCALTNLVHLPVLIDGVLNTSARERERLSGACNEH